MMIDVLIVEDEMTALERIYSFKLWNDGGYRILDTASNGREALKKLNLRKPDILITDIEMPVMNGIELIRKIRESDSELPVIVLSCHESFEYAREAVSLGVREYILKDFMEEKAVQLALSKTAAQVFRKRRVQSPLSGGAAAGINSRALMKAVNGEVDLSAPEFRDLQDGMTALVFIHMDGFSIEKHNPGRMLEEINFSIDELKNRGLSAVPVYADGGNFWVLIENDPVMFSEALFNRMSSRNISLTIAVGECFTGLENIPQQALAVKELYGFRVFLGCDRIILSESTRGIGGGDPSYIREKIDLIKKALTESQPAACFSILRELYDRDLPGMLKYNYLEYVNLRLLSLILSLVERGEINLRELAGSEYLSLHELEKKETVTEMREWFEDIFSRIFNLERDDAASRVSNRNILKIINIIKNRYDEDLTLDELAAEIGVHKVYLSRLFKKEVGRNYYDYLQSYRIGKAEHLLADELLKINEIATRTGFKSYDQFAVVFKKIKGLSPSDFRKKLFCHKS